MQRLKKTALIAASGVLFFTVIYAAALFLAPYLINSENFKTSIFTTIEKETGFKVSCEKAELKKGFSPYLKIHLHHTGVMYPDKTKFLQVKEADLSIKTLPLLLKKIEIKNAQLERPIINITLYKDFSTSLEKYLNNNKLMNTAGCNLSKFIPLINAKNYKIKFIDESINKTFYLEGETLQLSDIKLNDNMRAILKGAIFENKKEYIKYDLDILAALNNQNSHFTFSPFKTIYDTDVKGSVYGHLKTDDKNNITGSLKINNLSLNLGSVISSNNNANLLFKGNEVEFNALIHTSDKDSAKIQGKFAFGKKRFVDFNTNAKNINIENMFKIIGASSKIFNIKNPLRDFTGKGILNADFNIQSDFTYLKSSGNAEIVNASLLNKNFRYPVSGINAAINFNNNEIKIEKAAASINKTPITIEGTVKKDLTADLKAFSNNLDIKTLSSAFVQLKKFPIDLKKGILNFKTEINGNLAKNYKSHSIITVKDLIVVEKVSKIPINAKKCVINLNSNNTKYFGDAAIENSDIQINNAIVKAAKFELTFDEKNINLPKNIVTIVNSPVMTDGYINNYNSAPSLKLNFEGEIFSKDTASLISQYIKLPYKTSGKLASKGSIDYENEKWKLKTLINADKDNYISYLVVKELLNKPSIAKFEIEKDKDTVNIKEISLLKGNEAQIKLNGQIEQLKEPVFKNFNIVIPNTATIGANFFGGEELSLKGNLTFNNNIKTPDIKGNIKILKYNLKKYLTAVKNADISFSPDNIRLSAPDVIVNNSVLNITADIIPDFKNITVSKLHLNSINFDANSFFKLLTDIKNTKSYITVKNGSATINNFKVLDLKAHDISSDFKITDNTLKISNINANAYSGLVTGSTAYELGTGILDIDMEGKNINIKPSLYDLCKLNDNISGQADVKAHVSMLTGTYNTVIKSLSGAMEFNARNGSMGTLGRFEYYLNAQNLLYHGLLNATLHSLVQAVSHDDTSHFNTAYGKILLQNGKLITDNLHTQGEKMSLFIKGRHNIFLNQSNLSIYGRISDEISTKLGSFADVSISEILNGQESKKYNVVISVPQSIINEIDPLYNRSRMPSNTFKVNVTGNIKALNSINSFSWIIPELKNEPIKLENIEEQKQEEEIILPDFSDL